MGEHTKYQMEYIESVDGCAHQSAVDIIGALEQQCDELAEALKEVADTLEVLCEGERDDPDSGIYGWDDINKRIIPLARAALAKYRQPAEDTKIQYGCHCDLENMPEGYKPDECVFDAGNLSDCVYAKEGMSKWQCVHWKPISTAPELFPGTLDALRDLGRKG